MHGGGLRIYLYDIRPVVIFNVILFLFFLISFIWPKTKEDWASMGFFIGFIVALFNEMYGLPLTIYLLTSWFEKTYPFLDPFSYPKGHLLLMSLGLAHSAVAMFVLHLISTIIILLGLFIMYKGWMPFYQAKGERLVTESIYSHVRHPQCDGLFLIMIGFLIQWPNFTTITMWSILMFAYYRLSIKEDRDMEKKFGRKYLEYEKKVPAFIPKLSSRRRQ